MKPFVFVSAVTMCLLSPLASQLVFAGITEDVNSILRDKGLAKTEIGIEIVQLGASSGANTIVYRHNSDVPLTPASNLKVVTTSAALDQLGADFKFKTQLIYHGGDLILLGDGDPSFGDAELLTRVGWDVTTVFQHWAQQVKQLNIGAIKNVLVDDSIFDQEYFHHNWPAEQRLNRYEAEVAGMNLNTNCLDVFVRPAQQGQWVTCLMNPPTHFVQLSNECVTGQGRPLLTRKVDTNEMTLRGRDEAASDSPLSITIHDPPMYAGTVLVETMIAGGVPIREGARLDRTAGESMRKAMAAGDKSWQVLAIHETPLPNVMARANKDSMNLYGECLCKRLGAAATGQSGSWENGTAAVGAFLKKIGIPETQFHLDDGCGLSKENSITASALARVLTHNFFISDAKVFIDSLSIAGSDGTLSDRFAGSNLRGRVLGKSGTVNGVSCLSGYLHARSGTWYAFSILVNHNLAGMGKSIQEKIVAAIDNQS